MRTLLSLFAWCLLLCGCGSNNAASTAADAVPEAPLSQPVTSENAGKVPETAAVTLVKAAAGVQPVTDGAFAKKVLRNPGLTIVDFNAPWCGPCRMLEPMFKKAAADFTGKASFASMDVDENPSTSIQYNIRSIPLLLFFKGGQIVHRIVGLPDKNDLYNAIKKFL